MVVLATESEESELRRRNLARQSGPFPRNAGGRPGTNRRSYRDIPMTARKTCSLGARMPRLF